MSMNVSTIIIEDMDKSAYRARLETVLSRYDENRIFNIDTGASLDKGLRLFYAIILVEGEAMNYDEVPEENN